MAILQVSYNEFLLNTDPFIMKVLVALSRTDNILRIAIGDYSIMLMLPGVCNQIMYIIRVLIHV